MKNNLFENITPDQIIKFVNSKKDSKYLNLKPTELLKTEYISVQTIILKGNKRKFNNLISFWLTTQVWYGSDGGLSTFVGINFSEQNSLKKL